VLEGRSRSRGSSTTSNKSGNMGASVSVATAALCDPCLDKMLVVVGRTSEFRGALAGVSTIPSDVELGNVSKCTDNGALPCSR